MTDIVISDVSRRAVYTGSAGAGPYSFTFELLDEGDIAVYVNDDLQTITTDYTVSLSADGTGSITLVTAATASDTVVLLGNKGIARSTDFVTGGDLLAVSLNEELDAQTIFNQQNKEAIDRAIKIPVQSSLSIDTTLPVPQANYVLGWNEDGDAILNLQELGVYQGTDATTTTAAYSKRDLIKSTTAAQLNNVYICTAASVAGDLLTDTDHFELIIDAVSAATSAANAASSATAAATSATAAQTAQTAAETAETNAETAETNAETAQTAAEAAQTAAETAQTAAETAETNAETSETNAATSATNASTSATSAATSASTATTKASEASTSATNAATSATTATTKASEASTSATNAATSETNAATSATNAATSATNAATSETNASTSATAAAGSATSASSSASTAATKASEASTSATNASNSASAASTSETNAATSETNAATSATNASNSATNASTSASTASTKATEAATSATNAATSASSAATSKTAAEAAKDAALAALDSFDDRYLGQKTSDPTVDNDGDALVSGALYFNTTDDVMKVYEGSSWVAAYASLSGALLSANNLSDLDNASAARTNLGLVIGTDVLAPNGDGSNLTGIDALPTQSGQSGKYLTTNGTSASWDALATVANSGAYSDLSGTPTTVSTFTNDSGYITGNQTITLSGDVSGSGTTSISVTVADDSHNHVISNVDGLQTALDAKVDLAGDTMTGNLSFGDNVKAQFGDSQDLQIYHDGSHSYIRDTATGNLYVEGTNLSLRNTAGENYIFCQSDGKVELMFNNAAKLATTSTGVSVTGTVAATSFTGDGSALTGIASTVASGCIYENSQTITSNYTMTTNKNGHSAGPITINTGVTVTIPTGSNWVVS